MSSTKQLHDLGQSLWLDNITRDILDDGTLQRYIDTLSVTGLTSNPTIFDEAIGNFEEILKPENQDRSRKFDEQLWHTHVPVSASRSMSAALSHTP